MIVGILGLVISLFMYANARRTASGGRRARPLRRTRPAALAQSTSVRAAMVAAVRDARTRARRHRRPAFACRLRPARRAAPRLPAPRPTATILVAERRRRGSGRRVLRGLRHHRLDRRARRRPGGAPARPGRALTEAAVRWLRGRGAATVLLYATEAGRSTSGWASSPRARRRLARRRRRDPRPACSPPPGRRRPRAPERARPGGHGRAPRRTSSTPSTRWPAWPPTVRARSPAGRPRRRGARASPSAPATRGRRRADGRRRWRARPGTLIVPDANQPAWPTAARLALRRQRRARMRLGPRWPGDPSGSSACSTCSGVEGRASVPQPDPDLRGRAGDPCGFPAGHGVPRQMSAHEHP